MSTAPTAKIARRQDGYAHAIAKTIPDCGSGCVLLVNPKTSEAKVIPMRCHKWSCPSCAPLRLEAARDKARRGHPERAITLTCRPVPGWTFGRHVAWAKKRLRLFIQAARRRYGQFEYMVAVEQHKNGAPHFHILQRGVYMEVAWIRREWFKLTGNFIVYIQKVNNAQASVREITKYLAKTAATLETQLPGKPIITCSHAWIIDRPQVDPDYAEQHWEAHWIPYSARAVAEAGALVGIRVEPGTTLGALLSVTVRAPPPAPDIERNYRTAGQRGQACIDLLLAALEGSAVLADEIDYLFSRPDR